MKKITRLKKVLSEPGVHLARARTHPETASFLQPLSDSDVHRLSTLWRNGALSHHMNATFGTTGGRQSTEAAAILDKLSGRQKDVLRSEYADCGTCQPPTG